MKSLRLKPLNVFRAELTRRARRPADDDLRRSALIVAPHPDDETLGCGGTIAGKRLAGARVGIVFMTNGSGSHQNVFSRDELIRRRRREALAAANVLDVPSSDVEFFDFEESQLLPRSADAVAKLLEVFERFRPEEVYIPYYNDVHPDHVATNTIVREALSTSMREVAVLEYPVWFWHHWPWIALPLGPLRLTWDRLKASSLSGWGFRVLSEFPLVFDVREVLQQKERALHMHDSQVHRCARVPHYPILEDVADGDFLRCFFQGYEVFHHYAFSEGVSPEPARSRTADPRLVPFWQQGRGLKTRQTTWLA